jgi:hypothetical protein
MPYRDDAVALAARRTALEQEVAAKARELAETTRLLDEATARKRLPILDNIRVATPCRARWSEMTGDERVRDCGACNKTVYNLSGMTRDEAEALIVEKNGDLCARYFQRADGTILTTDCPVGAGTRRKKIAIAAGIAALAAGAAAASIPERVKSVPFAADHKIDGTHETVKASSNAPAADDPPPYAVELPPTEIEVEEPEHHHHEVLGAMRIEPLDVDNPLR